MARTIALGCVCLLIFALPAQSDPIPLPDDLQIAVHRAIDRGVRYLELTQLPGGTWAQDKNHPVGFAALPALTLLECGTSPKEPRIQKAAKYVRSMVPTLDGTYELALALLFLDKLGDKGDRPHIESLAARLIAGQTMTGGWSYRCPPILPGDQKILLNLLRQQDTPRLPMLIFQRPGPINNPLGLPGGKLNQPLVGQNPGLKNPLGPLLFPELPDPLGQGSTSSNPFGLQLGSTGSLYQPKPGQETKTDGPKNEPAPKLEENPSVQENNKAEVQNREKSLALVRRSPVCLKFLEAPDNRLALPTAPKKTKPLPIPQHLAGLPALSDVGRHWLVDPDKKNQQPLFGTTDNSNTQFAILALWAARRHDIPMARTQYLVARRFLTSQNADGSWGYPYRFAGGPSGSGQMTCVGLLGLALSHSLAREQGQLAHNLVEDPRVVMGFAALAKSVGQPTGQMHDLPLHNLYFLWSLERVGMLYNVPTMGGKDWYRWAAEVLVANQQVQGNWTGGKYPGSKDTIDTCLALLVLKRANLARDLTDRLPVQVAELDRQVILAAAGGGVAPAQEKKEEAPAPMKEPIPQPSPPKAESPEPKTASPMPTSTPSIPSVSTTTPTLPPITPTATESRGGFPWWILLVAGGLLIGGGLVWYTQSGKRNELYAEDEDRPRKKKKKKTT